MRRKAFTLVELLVVISIIAMLLAILMPALSKVREQSKRTICSNNQKQIGYALMIYANSNNDTYPLRQEAIDSRKWLWDVSYTTTDFITKSAGGSKQILYCPSGVPRADWVMYWRFTESQTSGWRPGNATPDSFGAEPATLNRSENFRITGYSWLIDYQDTSKTPTQPKSYENELTKIWIRKSTVLNASDREIVVDTVMSDKYLFKAAKFDNLTNADTSGGNPKNYGINDGSSHLVKSAGVSRSASAIGRIPAGTNVLFVDGHVAWRNVREMQQYRFRMPNTGVAPYWWW